MDLRLLLMENGVELTLKIKWALAVVVVDPFRFRLRILKETVCSQ